MSTLERRDTVSTSGGEPTQVVEPTFDENVLRALCDMDVSENVSKSNPHADLVKCGVPLLLDRIKQSMVSCRVST